ncbi:MAG TPA: hypothetical protein VGY77_03945 [Gemmataceae bacterium]|jgi:hypothetical protein|nr:hypothetical protein [Gemmataceae bacterium]
MFAMRWRFLVHHFLIPGCLVSGFIFPEAGLGQIPENKPDSELLEQARRLNEIAAQKLETAVKEALRDGDRLTAKEPARAVDILKKTQAQLEDDATLSENRRENLKRIVQARIRIAETAAKKINDSPEKSPRPNRPAEDPPIPKPEGIGKTLETIRSLQKDGRNEEARRVAEELARRYPDNAVVQATLRNINSNASLTGSRLQKTDQESRMVGISRDVQKSSLPPISEVEFPKDWQERVKKRSSNNYPLTEKEKVILKALNTVISVHFKETRFEDVITILSRELGQPLVLDKAAIQDEGKVNYDTLITQEMPRVSARTALRKILGEFGLTYIIKDQAIEVTTALKAKESMVTRTYFIGDLIGVGQFGGFLGLKLGGYAWTQQEMAKQVAQIIELIQTSIESSSWRDNGGGNGTISFYGPTMSLVIKNTAEIHGMISGYIK